MNILKLFHLYAVITVMGLELRYHYRHIVTRNWTKSKKVKILDTMHPTFLVPDNSVHFILGLCKVCALPLVLVVFVKICYRRKRYRSPTYS